MTQYYGWSESGIPQKITGGGGGITINDVYPVGSIYISTVSTNPNTLFGTGTWVAIGTGRVLVGINAADPDFDTVKKTGGEKTHTLISTEMPSHTHIQNAHAHVQHLPTSQTGSQNSGTRDTSTTGDGTDALSTSQTTPTNQNTGGDGAHNNLQPYIVVYMWERTA